MAGIENLLLKYDNLPLIVFFCARLLVLQDELGHNPSIISVGKWAEDFKFNLFQIYSISFRNALVYPGMSEMTKRTGVTERRSEIITR